VPPPSLLVAAGSAGAARPPAAGLSAAVLGTTSAEAPGPVPFDVHVLDRVAATARGRVEGWRTLTWSIPESGQDELVLRIDRGWGGAPQDRYTARYDAGTGDEVGFESFSDQSRGRRFRTFLRFAHTGEYFGVWGQTLAGFASLAGVILVWTGLALAWRRLVLQPLRRRAAATG